MSAAAINPEFIVLPDKPAVGQASARIALDVTAAKAAELVSVAISGGSFPKMFGAGLQSASDEERASTSKWVVYFADERCVPFDNDDSTMKAYQTAIAPNTQTPIEQVIAIGDVSIMNPQQLADDYALRLFEQEVSQSPLNGYYGDPNHPNGYRVVTVSKNGTSATIKIVDEKDNPMESSFTFNGTVDGTSLTVDFSPKGGPAGLRGDFEVDGIRWADGNKWPKLNPLNGIYGDPNHPTGYRIVTVDDSGSSATVQIVDERSNPAESSFTFSGTVTENGTAITVDFSPKGGPAGLLGTFEEDGIRWADGNKWPKIGGGLPSLDIIFLGMGPDGHTASLFPGHPLLSYSGESIVKSITDSPKPPPERITLTRDVICAAKQIVFVVTGGGKNEAITEIFVNGNSKNLSAGVVTKQALASGGRVTWILDESAAGDAVRSSM